MSINPVEFFAGAVLGTAFSALYAGVDELVAKNHVFRSLFKDIKSRLDTLKPLIPEMAGTNQQLSYTNKDELKGLEEVLKVGEELVRKCSKVSRWDLYRKYKYATKLLAWEEHLKKEFEVLQVQGIRDGKKTAVSVDQISSTLGEVNEMIAAKLVIQDHHFTAESKAWCAVPELSQLTVGLEAPLEELKRKILHDGRVSMIVVTAPGGCGKTTLATKFCQDQQVKDKFKDNIFFVTVSKKPRLDLIIQHLYRHKGSQVPSNFHNEVNAVQWLQTFLMEEGKKPLLLVLDDVWSGSESLLDKFQCKMTMYKILVTSRSEFPAFSSPYHLPLLGYEDGMKLFHHAASLGDKSSNIPPHLSKKIVERCKGFPLAITVVGRSLCGKPVEIWQKRVIEWSKGYLFLDSETDVLLSLQSSLDALDKENPMIKECFLDLGSFREDARTSVNALIDMWAELYDLEETLCIANLYELLNRSLANLVDNRRVKADGDEGYYDEHWISQHDLLRELAIYHSKLEPVEQRKRLIIEICGDRLPKWWREHNYQLINARLLSITIDGELSTTEWPNMQLPETEVLVLNLHGKNKYASLPKFVEKMDKLKVLIVTNDHFSYTELSNFELLSSLTNLKRIRLESVSISSIIKNPLRLKSVQKLSLFDCEFDEVVVGNSFKLSDAFPNLEEVNFHESCNLWKFPADDCDLIYLKKLIVIGEYFLSALPEEIGNLVNLQVLNLRVCIYLSKLPDSIRNLKKLYFLGLDHCWAIKELPKYIGEVKSLRKLDVRSCPNLRKLPESVFDLEQLEEVICDEHSQKRWEPLLSRLKNKNSKLNIIVAYSDPLFMVET